MKQTTILNSLIVAGLFSFGLTTNIWASFLPQKSAYANQSIYIEIPSAQKLTQQVKEFYMALRPDGGKTELQNIGEKLREKLGFNILEPRELEEAGIDPQAPIFISLREQTKNANITKLPDADGFFFHLYLPTTDSKLLYKILIASNKTTRVNSQTGELIEEQKGKEVRANQLYVVPNKKGGAVFTARGSDFVHITNNPSEIGDNHGLPPKSLVLGEDSFYQKATDATPFNRNTIARLLISPSSYAISKKQWIDLLGSSKEDGDENLLADYFSELEKNLDFSATLIDLDKKALQANSRSVFKDGYLQRKDTVYSQLIQDQVPSLPSDFVKDMPLAYLKLAVKPKLLCSIYCIIRHLSKKDIEQEFKEKTGISIEQDILSSFDGSMAVFLKDLPSMSFFKDFYAWNFFVQFGLQENGLNNLEQAAESFARSFNQEKNNVKFVKTKPKGETLWSFVNKDTNVIGNLLLLNKKTLVVNPKPQLLKRLKKQTKISLLDRALGKKVDDEKYPVYFFVDIKQLNEYFSREAEEKKNAIMLMILSYTQNMSFLSAYTKLEENEINSRFSLDLK